MQTRYNGYSQSEIQNFKQEVYNRCVAALCVKNSQGLKKGSDTRGGCDYFASYMHGQIFQQE